MCTALLERFLRTLRRNAYPAVLCHLLVSVTVARDAGLSLEPEVQREYDHFVRAATVDDMGMERALIERGRIIVGPRSGTKYKIIYTQAGQIVALTDRALGRSGTYQMHEAPAYLVTAPGTHRIQEYERMPRSGIYKSRVTGQEYLLISESDYEVLRRQKERIEFERALDSSAGVPAKPAVPINGAVSVKIKGVTVSGVLNARTFDTIELIVPSRTVPGATVKRIIFWHELPQSALEALMPERYASNMYARGCVLHENSWLTVAAFSNRIMRASGMVLHEGGWITAHEFSNRVMNARGLYAWNGEWLTQEEITNRIMQARGLVRVGGEWLPAQEATNRIMAARGLVWYDNAWISYQDMTNRMMRAQGYVWYNGTWISPADKKKLDAGFVFYNNQWLDSNAYRNAKLAQHDYDGLVAFDDTLLRVPPIPHDCARYKGEIVEFTGIIAPDSHGDAILCLHTTYSGFAFVMADKHAAAIMALNHGKRVRVRAVHAGAAELRKLSSRSAEVLSAVPRVAPPDIRQPHTDKISQREQLMYLRKLLLRPQGYVLVQMLREAHIVDDDVL